MDEKMMNGILLACIFSKHRKSSRGGGPGERVREEGDKSFSKRKTKLKLKGKRRAALNSQHGLSTANSKDSHSQTPVSVVPQAILCQCPVSMALSMSSSNLSRQQMPPRTFQPKFLESQSLVQTAFKHTALSLGPSLGWPFWSCSS